MCNQLRRVGLLALLAVLASCSKNEQAGHAANATSVQRNALTNVPVTFKFDDFSNVSLLQLNGSAVPYTNSLRLTDATGGQAGSVFCKQKVSLQNDRSFSTYFRMHITDPGSYSWGIVPADGIVFVIQPLSNNAGSVGSGIGYQGIGNSLGIEFDTYYNPDLGDPDAQHVGTHINGDMSSHLAVASNNNSWANGSEYSVWIDYNGNTNLLEVRVAENSTVRPANALLTQTIELSGTFGVDQVYTGFTSATGSAWSRHWIDTWYFQNDYAPIDVQNNSYTSTPTSTVVTASPSSNTRSSTITATVRNADGSVQPNWPVTLTTNAGTLSATSATTDANGQVQVTLTYAGGTATTATVGATASGGAYGYATVGLLANPTITASATGSGTISPSGAMVVSYGGSQTFTVAPALGNHITGVTVDGVSVGAVTSYTFSNVTVNHTIAASFAIDQFTVTASAGAHGTITPSGAQTVNYGGTASFTIAPASSYKISDVLIDGASVGAVSTYSFNNVTASHTIAASFALIDTPPTLTVNAGTTTWTEESAPVAVEPSLTLTDPDGPNLTGAKVSISSGYVASEDRLTFTAQGGITGTFNTSTGVLTLSGSAPVATYQAALRSVAYQNVSNGTPAPGTRQITYSLGATSLYNPDNGHYYEFVAAAGISWTSARDAAAARAYYGLQGYLVTVTSAAENAFVTSKLSGQGWMGASDSVTEWTWRWVTGPEGLENNGQGRYFFQQTSDYNSACGYGARGSAVGGYYQNWANCEPNDYAGNEDYAHFYVDGTWNDYPNQLSSIAGYVVEYGGMPGDPTPQLSGTRDLQVVDLPVYALTASSGANGSVSPAGTTQIKLGHSQAFSIAPAAHYHIADVLVDGTSVGAVGSYTFTSVAANHTLAATFAIDQFNVSASGDANGTISCETPVNYGASSTCTLAPSRGYLLASLSDNGADVLGQASGNTYVIASVTGDHTVQAGFMKALGTTCSTASECGSGSCVDGVCCNTACNGQCEACAIPGSEGTCTPVSGAPQGNRAACASDGSVCGGTCDGLNTASCSYPTGGTACRSATCSGGSETLAATCDGAGACPAPVVNGCNAYACGATACETSCSADAQCADGFFCSNGTCTAKQNVAATCSRDGECGSGLCVDGVCCNAACNGQCEACDVPGHEGECSPVTGAPHAKRTACADDGSGCGGSCNGVERTMCAYPSDNTACRAPSCTDGVATLGESCNGAGACPAVQTQGCGTYVCGATACLGDCKADSDCASGNWCSGGVCVAKEQPGQACGGDNQCGSGNCVDGVCCNTACNGQCEACDVEGSVGTCSPVSGAPHAGRAACASDGSVCGGTCDGSERSACAYPTANTQCRAPSCGDGVATLAAACDGSGSCPVVQTVGCAPFICGDTACNGDCKADTDCASGNWCAAGVCVAKAQSGASCGGDNQCDSGNCVDGVCCNTACNGQCEACDIPGSVGTCTPVSGAPHGTRTACATDGSICGGQCDGTHASACAYPSVECRAASCTAGTATLAATCNAGSCPAVQTQGCGTFACGATACNGECKADSDCASGSWCSAGMCVVKKASGQSCGASDQCSSGNCVDGLCCNTACDGQCEACDVAGSQGTCVPVAGAPHGARQACATDNSACGGTCDGQGRTACAYPQENVQCVSASCSNGVETHASSCNGAGLCNAPTTKLCGLSACGDTTCLEGCTSDSQCGENAFCAAGVCKPKGEPSLWKVQGGAGCSSGGPGTLSLLAPLALLLFLRRRRAAAAVAVAVSVGAGAGVARADANAQASRSFSLERFVPQAGAGDVLGVQSAQVAPHLAASGLVYFSYADRPLRAVSVDDSGVTRSLAVSQSTTTLMGSLGLFGRFEVGAALPIVAMHAVGADAVHPDLAAATRSFGFGDLRLSAKSALVERGPWALAFSLPFTLPTGNRDAFMGSVGLTANPTVIGQVDLPHGAAVLVNTGVALRHRQQLLNVTAGNAWTYAVGGKIDLLPRQNLALQANVSGELSFEGATAEQSPLEALAAVRWAPWKGLAFTLGGGPGLTPGYGTPRFRMLASVGWISGGESGTASARSDSPAQAIQPDRAQLAQAAP